MSHRDQTEDQTASKIDECKQDNMVSRGGRECCV